MSSNETTVELMSGDAEFETVSSGDLIGVPMTIESVPDTVSGGNLQQTETIYVDSSELIAELVGVNDKLLFISVLALVVFLWGLWKIVYRFFDMFF